MTGWVVSLGMFALIIWSVRQMFPAGSNAYFIEDHPVAGSLITILFGLYAFGVLVGRWCFE